MIAAIVLAAGKSERMGRPKALLPFRNSTFLECILSAISSSRLDDCVVVLGHNHAEIESRVRLPRTVFNKDYEQGMITSIQAGIRELSAGTTGAMLFLVDHPVVEPEVINELIPHLSHDQIVVPVFQGKRGHPVLFASSILDEIRELPASTGANAVVRKNPDRVVEVAVEDPGVLVDVDTPEQYERVLAAFNESRKTN